jgi:hypothetical protein
VVLRSFLEALLIQLLQPVCSSYCPALNAKTSVEFAVSDPGLTELESSNMAKTVDV